MLLRDKHRKQKKFVENKQQRNRVNCLVREAKKKYFQDLAGNKADRCSMQRAINGLTKGHSTINHYLPPERTPDIFNVHFASVVSKFLPDGHSDRSKYSRSDKLLSFCQDRNSKDYTFFILPLSVLEVGKVISKMDDKKSTG